MGRRDTIESKIVNFFESADLERVDALLGIVKGIARRRGLVTRSPQKKAKDLSSTPLSEKGA